jgi:hypothetical protein
MTSLGDIADLVGLDESEVAFLDAATPAQRAALVSAIESAGRSRDAALRDAVDDALGFVPRPLRGRVVKMLGGGGRRG